MYLILPEAADRIGEDDVLIRNDTLIEWRSFSLILKCLFGLYHAGYFGLAKRHPQLTMEAIEPNLLKTANKITLNQQTPAIAYTKPPEPLCLRRGLRTKQDGEFETSDENHAIMQLYLECFL